MHILLQNNSYLDINWLFSNNQQTTLPLKNTSILLAEALYFNKYIFAEIIVEIPIQVAISQTLQYAL